MEEQVAEIADGMQAAYPKQEEEEEDEVWGLRGDQIGDETNLKLVFREEDVVRF